MSLPASAHTTRPWRIHELTPDFRLEDVWALPTPGGPDDLHHLVEGFAAAKTSDGQGPIGRALFAIRWKVGEIMGWDEEKEGTGGRVPTLRDRLPADLRDGPSGPPVAEGRFDPLYLTHDEFAAEIANETMHGVLHLGWVEQPEGGYRGQMAVLVKPNGLRGRIYMAAIKPFRMAIIYPALLRQVARLWAEGAPQSERAPQPVS